MGCSVSVKEIYDIIYNYLKIENIPAPTIVPCGNDDVKITTLDASYTMEVFDWEIKYTFKNSLIKMLKWYDKYGVNQIYSHVKKPQISESD